MMHSLELQSSMYEVQPRRTVHVHRRSEHFLREGLVRTEIGGAHCEMRQGDLDV